MSNFTPRRATPDDCDEVLRLARLMWEAMDFEFDNDNDWLDNYRDVFRASINTETMQTFVIDSDANDRLIATGTAWIHRILPAPWLSNGKIGYLQWFSTQPEHRNQGLGQSVLDACHGWLVEQGCTRIHLHAAPKAIALYERNGFEPSYMANMWWRPSD